jgi:hypothetical protein
MLFDHNSTSFYINCEVGRAKKSDNSVFHIVFQTWDEITH